MRKPKAGAIHHVPMQDGRVPAARYLGQRVCCKTASLSVTSRAGNARVAVDITDLQAEIARIAESQSKLRAEIDAFVADLKGQR